MEVRGRQDMKRGIVILRYPEGSARDFAPRRSLGVPQDDSCFGRYGIFFHSRAFPALIRRPLSSVVCFLTSFFIFALAASAQEKINYQEHILPIFRNSCLTCHNPDKKKAGLDLSAWQTAINGSNNGQVVNPGDPDGSLLYRVVTHQEDPTMPPKKDKLPDKELDLIKRWIAGGAIETATGARSSRKSQKST